MKNLFKAIEDGLEGIFCSKLGSVQSSGGGGRKAGMTDEERNAEGDGRIPKFSEL